MRARSLFRRYAKVLIEVARKDKLLPRVQKDLRSFMKLLQTHPQLQDFFSDPKVSPLRKEELLEEFLSITDYEEITKGFLRLLSSRRRLAYLQEVWEAFQWEVHRLEGIEVVEVISPFPLSEGQTRSIARRVSRFLDKKVEIKSSVDPSLIGGVVIKIGDTVYDGSLKKQLQLLKEKFVQG